MDAEKIKSAFVSSKGTIKIVVITVVITAVIVYFLIPSKTTTQSQTIMVADTGRSADKKIDQAIKKMDDIQGEIGWLKKMFKISQSLTPTGGASSNPSTSPIAPVPPQPSDSGKKAPALYAYDFPLTLIARKNKIEILTMNPLLQYKGERYVKTYEFDRPTSDFDLALKETQSSNMLDGIILKTHERFISFDGITAGAGAMFPRNFYALLEIKFSMYERLHINPRLTSLPEGGVELKYDIIK